MQVHLHEGENLLVLPTLPQGVFTALVTDPPSGKGYMDQDWEASRGEDFSEELRKVFALALTRLIPGAWACVWAHPSTSHWTAVAIERAGFKVILKILHINPEAKAPSSGLLAPGHEEWILARAPGPLRGLNLRMWKDANSGRHPRTVVLANAFAKEIDRILGVRKSGAYSGKRKADKHRNALGSFKGTATENPREGSEGGASRYFPKMEDLLAVYGPRARHSHRLLGSSGKQSEHSCPKAPKTMVPLVDLVMGQGPGHVLDPWMGTGAIGEAAVRLGHQYTGIEKDSRWVAEANLRFAQEDFFGADAGES